MKRTIMAALVTALLATACLQGNVFSMEVGQCFNDPSDTTQVSNVDIVDCDEPHDNEVFHIHQLDGDDWPGQEVVISLAEERCLAAFDDYVNMPYLESEFDIYTLFPTEDSWESADDREVICALFDLSFEPTSGSARNSGR